jgi:ABC-type uncharacterized transport system substrate-binding protein
MENGATTMRRGFRRCALDESTCANGMLMKATSTIPIVAIAVGDPVRTGLVASLARPGGNITGATVMASDLSAKRLQLF